MFSKITILHKKKYVCRCVVDSVVIVVACFHSEGVQSIVHTRGLTFGFFTTARTAS